MKKLIKPCLVGLLNGLLTLTVSVAVADELVGPPEPAPARTQANPLTANTAPTFWLGGKVTTAFDAGPSEARSVVAQADGKLVVGGGAGDSYVLSRYLADGRLDETFGVGGRVLTPILFGCGGWAYSLVQQADGKLLLAGEGCGRAAVIRYLADGGLDASFGDAGIASHNLVFGFDGRSVAVQADGKLLLAGAVISPSGWDFALVRLLNNGSLDPTFGSGGYVTTDLGGYNNEQANSVLLQPDGKIVATGRSNGGFAVARYLANGVPDSGFGTQGKTVAFEDSAHSWTTGGFASALEADGKLLVAGTTLWGGTRPGIAVVRFLADGSLDANFGAGGLAAFNFTGWSHDEARAILQQPDGRIVVAGYSGSDFALLRLLSDGTLDSGFGGNGKLLTDFGSSDQAFGLAQHADGRLIAVGSSYVNDTRFALARYHPDGGLDLSFGEPGDSLAWPRTLWEQSSDRLGPLARILDTELAAAGTYDGATLTLRRQGGANAEDEFSAMSGGSLSVLTPGSYFAIDSITIGRVLTNGGGTLQLRFMGANATQARVDKAMQQIDYTNTSDRPPAQVLIDWTFDDGNTGAQGSGGALSTTGTVTVKITPINDAPRLVNAPRTQTAVAKTTFSYTLPADTFNDPDGDPLTWNLAMADGTGMPPWLNFNPATRVLSGTPTEFDIGTLNLRVTVTDPANAMASTTFTLQVVPGVLMGLAAQGFVGTDNQVQFGAFTIQGDSRRVLIRGLGPALNGYVPGFITDPKIALSLNGAPTPLEVNDDWEDAGNVDEIMALKHQPKNPTESVILRTLEPGVYNVHLSGSGGSTGIGMFQVYAVEGGGNGELKGLAAQGQVGTGNQVQFGAFTITGAPRKVLIRGLGPALNGYVPEPLENPRIALSLNGAPTPIETNDDWGLAENAAEIMALKHQPKNEKESAILRTLEPGVYNVHLSGSGGTEGIGMFQVYTVE